MGFFTLKFGFDNQSVKQLGHSQRAAKQQQIYWVTHKQIPPSLPPSFLPTFLPSFQPTYLPTYCTYLPTYLPTYLSSFLPSFLVVLPFLLPFHLSFFIDSTPSCIPFLHGEETSSDNLWMTTRLTQTKQRVQHLLQNKTHQNMALAT